LDSFRFFWILIVWDLNLNANHKINRRRGEEENPKPNVGLNLAGVVVRDNHRGPLITEEITLS
jgi:hypothetical protein